MAETVPYAGEDRCCFISDDGERCPRKATHWVGSNPVDDYTHVCAEHVADMIGEGQVVHELSGRNG